MKPLKSNKEIKSTRRANVDLRSYHTIFWQTGLILALLLMIGLTKVDMSFEKETDFQVHTQEVAALEEIVQTRQQPTVPPPPRPPVPVAVPNDVIIEDVQITINAEFDFSNNYLPPPPAPMAAAEEEEVEDFFIVVEQMPELIGGMGPLQEMIRYPEMARIAGIQGRVTVQFIVNERGEVENPVVVRGIGGGCDEEALRVIKMAKFTPGMQRGRPVRVQYAIPVQFMLRAGKNS
ncbi:MAG: energy transducer TonB [Balneolaceae bacterium]